MKFAHKVWAWALSHPMLTEALWVLPLALASGLRTPRRFYLLWTVGLVLPVLWRRIHPVGALVAVLSMFLAQGLVGPPHLIWTDVALLVCVYSVTATTPRQVWLPSSMAALFLTVAVPLAWAQRANSGQYASLILPGVASVLACTAMGLIQRAARNQRTSDGELERNQDLERKRALELATVNERNRIAREMHDIVAHSLSVMIAQADGGRYAAATQPEAATHALATIADTGRVALADMRRLLGVLRSHGDDSERSPQPRSIDLDTLIATVRDAGITVSVIRTGTERLLPPGAGLTVYRICQEALTNVLKHAGPAVAVTVGQFWRPTSLDLVITDDGRGAAATGDQGHGLVGMRERVAAFGGTLTAGPRPGGGFEVRVSIPLPSLLRPTSLNNSTITDQKKAHD